MLDYHKLANTYRPEKIKTLLIGEAPPPRGKTYFYLPIIMSTAHPIDTDQSLPATIFNHYFHRRPTSEKEYDEFLSELKRKGIFLIDIFNKPIKVRENTENQQIIIDAFPKIREKIKKMSIEIEDDEIVFLMPRTRLVDQSYKKLIEQFFPNANKYRWKDFRLSS